MTTEQTPVVPEPDGWLTDLLPQLTTAQGSILIAIGAITAAALAYLVAYLGRRQTDRHWQTTNRQNRFTTIATQLADPNAAVRIAAVASMEALIDDHLTARHWYGQWRPKYRRNPQAQAGINVLCAYLRLPATTHPNGEHTITAETITIKTGRRTGESKGREIEQTHTYNPHDDDVRDTILRAIAAHLRPKQAGRSWQHLDYDFTGAHLRDANFRRAQFRGQTTLFRSTRFDGDATSFGEARFYNKNTSFGDALFNSENTYFDDVRFHSWRTSFREARFAGSHTSFTKADFAGHEVSFREARFSGTSTSFHNAKFVGPELVEFDGTKFCSDGLTSFAVSQFESKAVRFYAAEFRGDMTSFKQVQFSGSQTIFIEAVFSSQETLFEHVSFASNINSFEKAIFDSNLISFKESPTAWQRVHFDWNGDQNLKPGNVAPDPWPQRPWPFD